MLILNFWSTVIDDLLPDFKIYTNFAFFCSCRPMFALTGLYPVDAWKRCWEMNAKRKSREKLSKTLDSRLKQQERHSEGEYEEVMEVKVGAS